MKGRERRGKAAVDEKKARRAPFAELASVFSNLGDVLKFLIPSSNSQTKYPEEGRGFCLAR